jgi:hypothetical protein
MRLSCAFLLVLGSISFAQDPKQQEGGFALDGRIDAKRVDDAIKKGIEYLRTSDSPGSHREIKNSDPLKLLTFIHAGVAENDPTFQDLFKKVYEAKLERTYQAALTAMCFEEIDRVKYQGKIAQCAQFLADNMRDNGHWSYGEPSIYADTMDVPTTSAPKDTASAGGKEIKNKTENILPFMGEKKKPKVVRKIPVKKQRDATGDRGDNSNTQYAALGMRACHDAGCVFEPGLIAKARQWWVDSQHKVQDQDKGMAGKPQGPPVGAPKTDVATGPGEKKPGGSTAVMQVLGEPRGWCYNDGDPGCGHGGKPYGSMSAGAVGAVCIYDYMLGRNWKGDKVVLDGLAWMNVHWSVTENVGPSETAGGAKNAWLYYYLYAVERTGMLYDTKYIGQHDWYYEGAKLLLDAQGGGGSWSASHFNHPTWDTCFAILFLKRATRRLDVATTAGGSNK